MQYFLNKPTIKDVAKLANVSIATVSRILNNLDGYSEDTRKKVMDVIEEIGYQRNAIARNLKINESKTIGILLPRVDTLFYVQIVNGIQDYANQNNYSVITCNVGRDGDKINEYLNTLAERQVDGMIVCSLPPKSQYDKKIMDSNIPSVLVSTLSYRYSIPYVKVDDYQAAYRGTSYLIENGHEMIAFLGGKSEDPIAGVPRLQGYIQALSDNNITVDNKLIKHNGFSFKDGILSMEQLLEETVKPTAIFAACDEIAIGALTVAHRKGIKIPDDISIIGYDNTIISEMCYPALTTIGQPLYDMGKKSVEMLIKKINYNAQIESVIMPFKIIERETVKKI